MSSTRKWRGRLSYANVTASVALFIALGGTAVAAVTLPRDSVGAPQIQAGAVRSPEIAKDAVRSPEIAKDAVRSPEIAPDAVRSSEIADNGIHLDDISSSAQNALRGAQGPAGPAGTTSVLIGGDLQESVPECDQILGGLTACPNLGSIRLPAGNWLVQAKFTLVGFFGFNNRCGLVQSDTTTIDQASELGTGENFSDEQIALSAVVTTTHAGSTIVAVRCNENPDDDLRTINGKLTALQVATVTGP
jgi:hypothetical protein